MLNKISIQFVTKHFPDHLNKEEIVYGLEILLSILMSNSLLIAIAFLLGNGLEMITFICFFNLLRVSAGGYHCKTHLGCGLLYYFTGFTVISLVHLVPNQWAVPVTAFCLTVTMFLIYMFAPTQTPNRPIFPKERLRFRRRSISTGYVLVLVIGILGALHLWGIALSATFALVAEALSLIHSKKERRSHI